MNKKSVVLNPPGQTFPLALSFLLLWSLCFPSLPLAESQARRLHETSRIFSMLQSSNMSLSHPSTRAVAETIWKESKKYSFDPMLVLAIIRIESEFRPRVVSTYGARGLMQLRPYVADALAEDVELESWEGEKSLDDPIINIKLGVFYLGYLKERFGDLRVALTAYNLGPTWVQRRLKDKMALPFGYASKVLSMLRDYREQSRIRSSSSPRPGNART
jgi:soluble lytic murein transglycosylase-like protein